VNFHIRNAVLSFAVFSLLFAFPAYATTYTIKTYSYQGEPLAGQLVFGRLCDRTLSDTTDANGEATLEWVLTGVPEARSERGSWGAVKRLFHVGTPAKTSVSPSDLLNGQVMIDGNSVYWNWLRDFGINANDNQTVCVMITPKQYRGVSDFDVALMKVLYDVPVLGNDNKWHPTANFPLKVDGYYVASLPHRPLNSTEIGYITSAIDDINARCDSIIPGPALAWAPGEVNPEEDNIYIYILNMNSSDFNIIPETQEIEAVTIYYKPGSLGIGNWRICAHELARAISGISGNSSDSRLGILQVSPQPWTSSDISYIAWGRDKTRRTEELRNDAQAIEFNQ